MTHRLSWLLVLLWPMSLAAQSLSPAQAQLFLEFPADVSDHDPAMLENARTMV